MTVTSRHDFRQPARDLLNYAVKINVIDAIELAVLVVEHGNDVATLRDVISLAAFASRHHAGDRHRLWCRANDAFSAIGRTEDEMDAFRAFLAAA